MKNIKKEMHETSIEEKLNKVSELVSQKKYYEDKKKNNVKQATEISAQNSDSDIKIISKKIRSEKTKNIFLSTIADIRLSKQERQIKRNDKKIEKAQEELLSLHHKDDLKKKSLYDKETALEEQLNVIQNLQNSITDVLSKIEKAKEELNSKENAFQLNKAEESSLEKNLAELNCTYEATLKEIGSMNNTLAWQNSFYKDNEKKKLELEKLITENAISQNKVKEQIEKIVADTAKLEKSLPLLQAQLDKSSEDLESLVLEMEKSSNTLGQTSTKVNAVRESLAASKEQQAQIKENTQRVEKESNDLEQEITSIETQLYDLLVAGKQAESNLREVDSKAKSLKSLRDEKLYLLTKKQNKVDEVVGEAALVQKKHDDFEREISQIQKESRQLDIKKTNALRVAKSNTKEIISLGDELIKSQETLRKKSLELEILVKNTEETTQELDRLHMSFESTVNELDSTVKKNEHLSMLKTETESKRVLLTRELSESQARLSLNKDITQNIVTETQALQEEIDRLTPEIRVKKDESESLEEEIRCLEGHRKRTRNKHEATKKNILELRTTIQSLQEEKSELVPKFEIAKSQLEVKEVELLGMEKQKQSLSTKVESAQQALTEVLEKIEVQKITSREMSLTISEMLESNDSMSKVILTKKKELENLHENIKQQGSESTTLKEDNARKSAEVVSLDSQLATFNKSAEKLIVKVKKAEMDKIDLEEKIGKLKFLVNESQEKIGRMTTEFESKKAKISHCEKIVSDLSRSSIEKLQRIDELETDIIHVESQVNFFESELAMQSKRSEFLDRELKPLGLKLKNAQDKLLSMTHQGKLAHEELPPVPGVLIDDYTRSLQGAFQGVNFSLNMDASSKVLLGNQDSIDDILCLLIKYYPGINSIELRFSESTLDLTYRGVHSDCAYNPDELESSIARVSSSMECKLEYPVTDDGIFTGRIHAQFNQADEATYLNKEVSI